MRVLFFITLLIVVIAQPIAHAYFTFAGWAPLDEVRIRVGAQTGVTTVTHNVPATQIGDGTPIEGAPASVIIEASARRARRPHLRFIISVDSSTPLSNGSNTISFTNISWTAEDGGNRGIPSGNFDGSPAQVLVRRPISTRWLVTDYHTFYYNNTQIVPSGTYTGSVTYTVSVP